VIFPPSGQVVPGYPERFELLKTQLAVCQCTPFLALVIFNACRPIIQGHFSVHFFTKDKGIVSVLIRNYLEKRQKQTFKAKQFQPLFKPDFRWFLFLLLRK